MLTRHQQLVRKSPLARGGPLRRVSAKRAKQNREYSKRRRAFLSRPENRWCPVAASGLLAWKRGDRWTVTGFERRTTDCHHRDGREGKLLNAEDMWLAVSREGHEFIHAHPNEARKRGWLV